MKNKLVVITEKLSFILAIIAIILSLYENLKYPFLRGYEIVIHYTLKAFLFPLSIFFVAFVLFIISRVLRDEDQK